MCKLDIQSRQGSVEHYFHFLLGFCVPLVNFHLAKPDVNRPAWLVRECGPMTRILRELPIKLEIVSKTDHAKWPTTTPGIKLLGYDSPAYYSRREFLRFGDYIAGLTPPTLTAKHRGSILLVEREQPDPYYASAKAENKWSGKGRRSIRNHREIMAWLNRFCNPPQNVQLANRGLREQCSLFRAADLVIAQHGAALANMIFMRKGSHVVEIGCGDGKSHLFKELAAAMELKYTLFDTTSDFPIVNPIALLQTIDHLDQIA